jgi:23S rRNA (adenine2030-N6)-methyltransferase
MLSYQHLYHAGNQADVHKHAMLAVALEHMGRKDKPYTYFETHAGRGLYDLSAPEALKTGEAARGIGRMLAMLPPSHPYAKVVARVRAEHGPGAYPGSPLIAAMMQRPGDLAHLAELHPQEFMALEQAMQGRAAMVYHRDGIELALSKAPPEPKRGLLLIDPSYEVKEDYEAMPHHLYHLHRKWNVGVLMLWYPILTSGVHAEMVRVLDACNFPGGFRHEVAFAPAKAGHGMVGSGLFVVNTPFGFAEEASRLGGLFRKLDKAPPKGTAPRQVTRQRRQ